jgi:hypothetical protein
MDYQPIIDFLLTLSPSVSYILMALGTLVTLGLLVDSLVPDEKDKGFMSKILGIPLLGDFLKFLTRFSPLNIKDPNKE